MAGSIVVENGGAAGCIQPGTKGAVMRGIKEAKRRKKGKEERRRVLVGTLPSINNSDFLKLLLYGNIYITNVMKYKYE